MENNIYIIFLLSVIGVTSYLIISLLRIPKGHMPLPPSKTKVQEGVPYPKPYQPPTKKVDPKRGEELPIHRIGDWVYDPNINYRPRKRL